MYISKYRKIKKKANILQIEEAKKNVKHIKAKDIKIATNKWKASPPVCLKFEASDISPFGSSLAINNQYLAVGDSLANRVIIYTRDEDNRWQKNQEILPPQDSVSQKISSRFGRFLALDGEFLITSALINKQTTKANDLKDSQADEDSESFNEIYRIRLDKQASSERLGTFVKDSRLGSDVVADGGKIIFLSFRQQQVNKWIRKINVFSDEKFYDIDITKYTEKRSKNGGIDFAIKNNLHLFGMASQFSEGIAWLFNLNSPQSPPQILIAPNAKIGDTVAISQQFAVVGVTSRRSYMKQLNLSAKTLIKSLNNGLTTTIDGYGKLSLYNNILARFEEQSRDGADNGFLEVFYLNEDATPTLILTRENIKTAFVQNNFLVTVRDTNSGKKICTEELL